MNAILIQAITVFLPAGYLAAALLYSMAYAGNEGPDVSRFRAPLLRALTILHLALFVLHGAEAGGFPMLRGWLSLSLVAFAVVMLFAVVTWRHGQATVGALVLLVVALLQMLASMFGPTSALVADRGPASSAAAATGIHVITAAVACAALVLSGLYGFLYLTLLRQMKRQTFGAIFRQLPDLTQLAGMTRRAALAGFLGLTLGVNIGIGVAHAKGTAGFQYTDPIVILTLALWFHFGLIAFSGKIRGLSAQRASLAAVAGLTVLVGTLLLAVIPGATFHALR
ncbi:MAG: ABC-type transport system involved in cytochrome c biogenesis permease subunit [Planctomycetota bacterium]|jgi:ABC-type transport system involved in cytochrome c biogenesis permease subunit